MCDKMTPNTSSSNTTKHIQLCLLLIELSTALAMAISAYLLLKILRPFKFVLSSWTATVCSTLIGLWIIKSTVWALSSLKSRSVPEGRGGGMDLVENSMMGNKYEKDELKLFESRHCANNMEESEDINRSEKPRPHVQFAGEVNNARNEHEVPAPSKQITETKQFLMDNSAQEKYEHTTKTSFTLLAVLATVILQCALRIFIIVQNIRRSLPWRRGQHSKRNGLIGFVDIPFTLGRSMSSSGAAFHIFSFLNGWLECNSDGQSQDGTDARVVDDNIMILQAVSFDRISISSSHFTMRPPRKFNPGASSQLSWLGISFEDIDLRLTIHLKQKGRMNDVKKQCIQSLTIRFRMKEVEFGVFPSPLDRVKCIGMQVDVNAAFDSKSSIDSGRQTCLSGFGISANIDQMDMHRFNYASSSEQMTSIQSRVLSWGIAEVSLHLQNRNEGGRPTRSTASLLKFPSGFVAIQDLGADNACTDIETPSPKQAYVNIGDISCNNRLVLGVNLRHMLNIVQSMETLLNNMASSMIRGSAPAINSCTPSKKSPKTKKPLEVVEMNATLSMLMFAPDTSNETSRGCFSLGAPRCQLHWRNNAQSASSADQITQAIERNADYRHPLLLIETKDARVQYTQRDNSSINALDLVLLKQIKAKVTSQILNMADGSSSATIDLGGIVVRAGGEVMGELSHVMRAAESVKFAVGNLQRFAKEMKDRFKKKSTNAAPKRKHILRQIDVTCNSVDAVIELHEGNIEDNGTVRLSLLTGYTTATVSRRDGITFPPGRYDNFDLQQPDQLFEYEAKKCPEHFLIEATVAPAETSVTFCPHPSLPLIDKEGMLPSTTFYARATKLTLKSINPLKKQTMNSTTESISSKAMCINFDRLHVHELNNTKSKTSHCLLSIPVNQISFRHTFSDSSHKGWPMAQTLASFAAANLVKIIDCKGNFCLVEKRNTATGEKTESMSIQFTKGATDLELVWSPVFQWLQISCINRIQRAIAHFKTTASTNALKQSQVTSQKTNIRIGVDPNVSADVYAFIGVKSLVHVIFGGGIAMDISIAKHLSLETGKLKQTAKPNISFQFNHTQVFFNDISTPIFIFQGLSLQNYLRSASDEEINQYKSKKGSSEVNFSEEVATDQDGHPLKEIFDLNLGRSAVAKFPPELHFGEVIEDFVLLPKALNMGLDSMKEVQAKSEKKYQIMSIKCSIPFLDMALMDTDPDVEQFTPAYSLSNKHRSLRDQFRICFEDAEISIERNTPREITQQQINALDEDNSSTHAYGPVVQGGLMNIGIKHVFCTIYPLNLATPMVCIDDFGLNGNLHLAGLSPETPGIQQGRAVTSSLLCHHYQSPDNRDSAFNTRQCCCCYGVSMHSAGIPVKVYTDSKITCGDLNISWGPVMGESMPQFMECFKRILPPPPKSNESTIPLTWWDNTRFFVHGSISIFAEELSFRWLLDSHMNRDQSILLNCQKILIAHTVGSFDLDATSIQVSIPGIGYDMSVHPSARDMTPTFHLPHEAESAVDHGRHPLLYIGSLKTEIKFVWKMLQPGRVSSMHHSVYVQDQSRSSSDSSISLDKFAPVRTDGTDVEFDIELAGNDLLDNWVALRIDVLPWFTHLNSAISYTPPDEDKPEPFPKLYSVAIEASTSSLRVATWFEDETEFDGLCLILKRVSYNSTGDGINKDIIIEGPVKAAILDMWQFKQGEKADRNDNDMFYVENAASDFGVSQSSHDSERSESHEQLESPPGNDDDSNPFLKLQQLSCDIDELDYVIRTGQIDIINQSLASLTNKACRKTLVKSDSKMFVGVDRTTWSILVSRLKLLWTLEIRDSIFSIVKDLIYTLGFMKSQKRQLHLLLGLPPEDEDQEFSDDYPSGAEEGFELSLRDEHRSDSSLNKSMLAYLLEEKIDVDTISTPEEKREYNDTARLTEQSDKKEKEGKTLPTLDVHLSNPQIQLHSTATGGSIVLAMEGAHVEGRKFVHFIVANAQSKAGNVAPSDLLRKTEHTYTLQNLEGYSLSTQVDVNIGLPWLDVSSPGNCNSDEAVALEDRFGISGVDSLSSKEINGATPQQQETNISSHQYIYPPHLRHHEPLPFLKSGILRPILDRLTIQSKQIFHRPPIHYSTDELIRYMKQGLVVGQDEAAVDDIELRIDLLNFNLDSYQFKTTIDVIRNCLLEPPKPHQRHQSLHQDEDAGTEKKPEVLITSEATAEVEEVLKAGKHHGGKKGRQILQNAAMSLLRDLEDKIAVDNSSEVFRRVSYSLSKLQWSIQSEEEIDGVNIAFTGFNGQHDYSRDGSISSQFWLEDLLVESARPGPDSIGFADPTSVIKSVLGNERSPCERCGQRFDHSKNGLNSCMYHPGQVKSSVWSCCGAQANSGAPGCKSGPHTGKERAAVVRVEALPRVVDGISLYSHFEVNLFPGVLHTLVVQISKSLSRLFMSYFFIGNTEADEEELDTASLSSDVTGSTADTTSMRSDLSSATTKPTVRKKAMLIGGKGGSPTSSRNLRSSEDFLGPDVDNTTQKQIGQEEVKEPEIAFIKVWRVGVVDIDVSLGGFKRLPLSSLSLNVPAYSKAYDVGPWEYHSRKYLTYLVREVLKSGASSGLDKFKRKVMGTSTPTTPAVRISDESESNDSASPRSGPPALPTISDSGPADSESFIGRHLRRSPVGAADILGTPAKKSSKKKKKITFLR